MLWSVTKTLLFDGAGIVLFLIILFSFLINDTNDEVDAEATISYENNKIILDVNNMVYKKKNYNIRIEYNYNQIEKFIYDDKNIYWQRYYFNIINSNDDINEEDIDIVFDRIEKNNKAIRIDGKPIVTINGKVNDYNKAKKNYIVYLITDINKLVILDELNNKYNEYKNAQSL